MKLLEIKSCEFCRYLGGEPTRYRCLWHSKLPQRNIINIHTFPDWCPLPDASQQINTADEESQAVLEGVDYKINYIDADTISLTRC